MEALQWWCVATGEPWTWSWQAYPGIWLAVAVTAFLVWRVRRREPGAPGAGARAERPERSWRTASAAIGLVLLWLSLDWPVGPLGTGYLASAHALQFVLLAMIIPALLLLGVDRERIARGLERRPALARVVHVLTQPVLAAVGFTLVMFVTHVPRVVDALMAQQLGVMVLDLGWFVSGLWLWWPVLVRVPERAWFSPPAHVLYLFLATQGHLLIAMWLLTSEFPVYATYELAPRVTSLSALEDQQVAGGLMLGIGGPLVLGAISAIFLRWANRLERQGA